MGTLQDSKGLAKAGRVVVPERMEDKRICQL